MSYCRHMCNSCVDCGVGHRGCDFGFGKQQSRATGRVARAMIAKVISRQAVRHLFHMAYARYMIGTGEYIMMPFLASYDLGDNERAKLFF
jgi:hypothetical protein